MVDLHCHSTASDGALAPSEVVARAAQMGVTTLALTDHDTFAGVAEARVAADRLGIRVIPGVEMSVAIRPGSMHLLGYFADPEPAGLTAELARLREGRVERARRIVATLATLGAPIDLAAVLARAAGPVGRPHIAAELVAAGHVTTRQEAFDRFLGDGSPAWRPSLGLDPIAAVRLVRQSGGAPVLAHPASLRLGPRHLEPFIRRLAAAGLAGIEVHRPDHPPDLHRRLATLAARAGLIASGGSDFHSADGDADLGDTGAPALPSDVPDRLLAGAGRQPGGIDDHQP